MIKKCIKCGQEFNAKAISDKYCHSPCTWQMTNAERFLLRKNERKVNKGSYVWAKVGMRNAKKFQDFE